MRLSLKLFALAGGVLLVVSLRSWDAHFQGKLEEEYANAATGAAVVPEFSRQMMAQSPRASSRDTHVRSTTSMDRTPAHPVEAHEAQARTFATSESSDLRSVAANREATNGATQSRSHVSAVHENRRTSANAQTSRGSGIQTGRVNQETEDEGDAPALVVPISPNDPRSVATIPAVLALMPSASRDEAVEAVTGRLAKDFFHRIAGESEDPRDPAHQRRWMEAQEETDAQMRARLGGQVWLDHHREVHRQVLKAEADPK